MKCFSTIFLILILQKYLVLSAPQISTTNSLVVSSTEAPKEAVNEIETSTDVDPLYAPVPKIYEMNVRTNVSNRFATTLVTNKMMNAAHFAREATFSVILPEAAYISGFVMEIDGKSYKAYVKEREEAKQIYDQAVASGIGAAHVTPTARDSNRFTVSVNVEPQSKVIFKLTYDELLQRQNGQYEVVLNIHPGQVVKMLDVQIYINESRPLRFVRTPSLRTGNEISKNDEELSPSADITIQNKTALVMFNPDEQKQRNLAADLGTKEGNGLAGQFVVQYDVERDASGGEVLLKDGYFVHFFAPSELKPLPKYVIFVLDTSSSMKGTRIRQLREAINSILTELKTEDIFSIVKFNSGVEIWNVETMEEEYNERYDFDNSWKPTNQTPGNETVQALPQASAAHEDNVLKAKTVVNKLYGSGATDIQSALKTALLLIKKTNNDKNSTHQPIVLFLTDGEPTVGETDTDKIISTITELNSGENRSPIFSISFGDEADRKFLQKISLKNLGFSRHIYEAADASLQLQEFYRQISSPLLTNVSFKYTSEAQKLTKTYFPIFFDESEIMVCGTVPRDLDQGFLLPKAIGLGPAGPVELTPNLEQSEESLEKLWAYLTIKQVLEQRDAADNKSSYTNRALEIALKYSFVTPVSSLVVVKPNGTKPVDTEDASKVKRPVHPYIAPVGASGYPVGLSGPSPMPKFGFDNGMGLGESPGYSWPEANGYSSSPYHASAFTPLRARDGSRADGVLPLISPTHNGERQRLFPYVSMPTIFVNLTGINLTDMPNNIVLNGSVVMPNISDRIAYLKTQLPWLNGILKDDGTLTTPQGAYKLGVNRRHGLSVPVSCPKTPDVNGEEGYCEFLSDCPHVFYLLTNVQKFTKHFCPLEGYAGICCPRLRCGVTESTSSA